MTTTHPTTQIAAGDQDGPPPAMASDDRFTTLVVPEIEVLYRVARRLTGNAHDAEDVVQETLIRAYRAIDRFDGRHPRAWLLTILRNTNRNRVRKRVPDLLEDEWRTLGAMPAAGAEGRDAPGEAIEEMAGREQVVEALRRLPEHHRAVVALIDLDDLTYMEAAEVLGIPIGTVMSRLHRARRKLRRVVTVADLGRDVL